MLSLMRVTGGMIFLGDDITQLKASKIELIKKLLPPTGIAAIPRGFMNERLPHIPDATLENGVHEVTIINWKHLLMRS